MSQIVTIGLVQHACSPDTEQNLDRTLQGIRGAARLGARIVCTQELFRTRYFCQSEDHAHFDLAEPIPGPTTGALCAVARENGVVVVASLFEKRAPGLFHNTAVVIDADGTLLGRYRKMHIPDDPLYYEKFYFTPGDLGFRTWNTRFGRIGVLVCWDQWFPEAARLTALSGAQILFYPTAIGWHPAEKEQYGAAQHAAWQTIQRSHAIANGVFVAAANRIGFEPAPEGAVFSQQSSNADAGDGFSRTREASGVEFWGGSFVAGPDGQVIAEASTDQEEALVVPVDLARVDEARMHWPFLRDRRIDAYTDLQKRYTDGENA